MQLHARQIHRSVWTETNFQLMIITFLCIGNPLYHPTKARADSTPCKSCIAKQPRFYNVRKEISTIWHL